ncbi:hypothetical protein B0H16DRAFT_1528478, partial [Mycena metata]
MAPLALPIDLEREIFECAALCRPVGIPALMLVAWRVKTWVEPLLYRTIVLWPTHRFASMPERIDRQPTFLRKPLIQVIKSKPASFFHDSVRHLMIPEVPENDTEGQFILSACTGVEDLWIYQLPPYLLPFTRNLPLRRLHCGLTELFVSKDVDFTHPLFANITHLELIDSPKEFDQEKWSGLALIPNLTHLAFNGLNFLSLWAVLLDQCRSLRLLVCLVGSSHSEVILSLAARQDDERLPRDPRFVVMQCEEFEKDWQMGAHTGEDYWARGEAVVAKHRSGEVDGAFRHNVLLRT